MALPATVGTSTRPLRQRGVMEGADPKIVPVAVLRASEYGAVGPESTRENASEDSGWASGGITIEILADVVVRPVPRCTGNRTVPEAILMSPPRSAAASLPCSGVVVYRTLTALVEACPSVTVNVIVCVRDELWTRELSPTVTHCPAHVSPVP